MGVHVGARARLLSVRHFLRQQSESVRRLCTKSRYVGHIVFLFIAVVAAAAAAEQQYTTTRDGRSFFLHEWWSHKRVQKSQVQESQARTLSPSQPTRSIH